MPLGDLTEKEVTTRRTGDIREGSLRGTRDRILGSYSKHLHLLTYLDVFEGAVKRFASSYRDTLEPSLAKSTIACEYHCKKSRLW